MNPTCLTVTLRSAVAEITLNRPEVHNAFDEVLIAELTEIMTELCADAAVRAVVLRGAGPSFCAGADLGWMGRMAGYSHSENLADARAAQRMFQAIAHSPKVTIARVHGAAIGGGAGLVAVCDLAIADETAKFALSEVRLGLVPSIIGPYVLQKVGMGAARALFVTGERFGAADALRIGLVNEVVAADALDTAIERKLELVRQAGPEAIRTAKQLLRDIAGHTPDAAANTTVECIAALRVSSEGQEGINAFLQKRKPNFAE
ncbi:MAG TPA: enoyl-CoA hydratase-related protein [Chthonomonadaceae bacterium]|nr:enoyl-CoA hydratase-related protein [Chthonomonadaceae bacterium]